MIRRLLPADCEALSAFLGAQFDLDPASGGAAAPSKDFLEAQIEKAQTWVCEEDGKLVGVLGPRIKGQAARGDKTVTFDYYNRLVVDVAIYDSSPLEAGRIAAELTLAAFEEVRDTGDLQDYTRVEGLTKSRGASWMRYLGKGLTAPQFEEIVRGDWSVFWLESVLIGEQVKATGFLT